MAGTAVRETATLAGRAERARVARAFVGGVLGSEHPCGVDAALLVSELFGNSLRHSQSGAPGETVTIAVKAVDGVVRVEVTDRSGPGVPELKSADRDGGGSARRPDGYVVRAVAPLISARCPLCPSWPTPGAVWRCKRVLAGLGIGESLSKCAGNGKFCQGGPT